jgi:hypothetical protein
MYGITAGGAPANLVTIDLGTGTATVVGPTGLDRIGSIEFGPDGNLYGGVTASGSSLATYLVRIDKATGAATPIGETGFSITGLTSCFDSADSDGDGISDDVDNCPQLANGPLLGTCYAWTGMPFGTPCGNDIDCGGEPGSCSMDQEDSYPPGGNGCGDVCECEGNFDGDEDQDGSDAATFKLDFGRLEYNNPCTVDSPCNGDFDCDNDCDGTDASTFKADFGRLEYNNPCPNCATIPWCVYQ